MSLLFPTNPSQTLDSSLIPNLTQYFEATHQLFSSVSLLQASQKQLFELINGRFDLFDIIIQDFILSNKKRKKKFFDLYQEETMQLLQKTSQIYQTFHKGFSQFDHENLMNLSRELIKKVEIFEKKLEFKPENNLLKPFRKESTLRRKETDDEVADVISSRRDLVSSNRILISAKTKAFSSVLNNEDCNFSLQKKRYFNESFQNGRFSKREKQKKFEENKENLKENSSENLINPVFTTIQEKKIILNLMKSEYSSPNIEGNSLICHRGNFL